MSQINRVPWGLQDFLGSQNFGDNPSQLGQVVQPVLDVFEFLKGEKRFWHISSQVIANADGALASVTVPKGELWLVEAVGIRVTATGAGGPYDCHFSVTANGVNNSNAPTVEHNIAVWRLDANPSAAGGAAAAHWMQELSHLLPLTSGEELNSYAAYGIYTAGVQYNTALHVRYIKLSV